MPYLFNPHKHVKIWFSLDRDSFLNNLNKARFIEMRKTNPADEIHFIYDSRLLSDEAQKKLRQFCIQHEILPHDFLIDVIPKCETPEELELVREYEKNRLKISQGIHVGSMSDIVRWLGPVYRLGSYNDYDTRIDTAQLNATIEVKSPLLLNLNKISMTPLIQSVDINCDMISVVDESAALESIKKIQMRIVKNCSTCTPDFSPYQDFMLAGINSEKALKLGENGNLEDADRKAMHQLSQDRNVYELRDFIMENTANNAVFVAFINKNTHLGGAIADIHTDLKRGSSEHKITIARTFLRQKYLINTVIYTTGTGPLVLSLFPDLLYEKTFMETQVLPYSYAYYNLTQSFYSGNLTLPSLSGEISNDLSWLKDQETVINERMQEEQTEEKEKFFHKSTDSSSFFSSSSLRQGMQRVFSAAKPETLPKEVVEAVSLYNKETHKKALTDWLTTGNIHTVDENGRSLLHYAAATGKLALVDYFVDKKKCPLEVTDHNGYTALIYATQQLASKIDMKKDEQYKIIACVEALLKKGAKVVSDHPVSPQSAIFYVKKVDNAKLASLFNQIPVMDFNLRF